jgi:hypothetical protein
MELICPNNCDAGRYENVGFRLVGVPLTVMSDLTIDGDQIHSAVINIEKGLIPGAKILCGGCHQNAVIEEYKKVIEADIDVR